ncbi:unnamed protein product [Hyaloperonospora brassicae]|uniref:Uncharacterized protein n=1 Tax=Hyaloperonospora brassicae TaxID=162125 RepID=A0AAV0TKQ3_HYABA|nr:unnamed protein product [Hyaloperonospora brassicae]
MSLVLDNRTVARQPSSTATTVPLGATASGEPDDCPSCTSLAPKGAGGRRPHDRRTSSATAPMRRERQSPYWHELDKLMVQFKGLYVVRGPTESKHVRYTMDIAVAELQLHGRCIQRFRSFFFLRKRLLEVLKTCRGRRVARTNTSLKADGDEPPHGSAGVELMELLARPRCAQCVECAASCHALAAVKFPRRTLLPPSLEDVHARSPVLESFLECCVRIATTASTCHGTKRLFTMALGKFLGVDLRRACLGTPDEGHDVSVTRSVGSVDTGEGREQLREADESCNDVDLLSKAREADEDNVQSDGERRSDPNFAFVSDLAKGDKTPAVMVRSKSHC